MNILSSDFEKDYDINGKVHGLVEIKRLSLYEIEDREIPSAGNVNPKPPCFVIEVLDEELSSSAGTLILTPTSWFAVKDSQVQFLKEFWGDDCDDCDKSK